MGWATKCQPYSNLIHHDPMGVTGRQSVPSLSRHCTEPAETSVSWQQRVLRSMGWGFDDVITCYNNILQHGRYLCIESGMCCEANILNWKAHCFLFYRLCINWFPPLIVVVPVVVASLIWLPFHWLIDVSFWFLPPTNQKCLTPPHRWLNRCLP